MSLYRSLLFAPGSHARRVEKSISTGADAVIFDLEDAVAASEKSAARELVAAALERPRHCKAYVRVNGLATPWCYGDLTAMVREGLDGIMLPKVEHATDLLTVDWLLAQLERERGLPDGAIDILPLIETALGFSNLRAITRAGTRVRRLAFGAGDFTLDLGLRWSSDEAELLPYRSAMVLESRAAGLEAPIDTVWVDLAQKPAFERSARLAGDLGFQGKLCIHPQQVGVVNSMFSPGEAEVAHAARVVDAFIEAESQGTASIVVDGRFVDYPIVYQARRTLARHALIAEAGQKAFPIEEDE